MTSSSYYLKVAVFEPLRDVLEHVRDVRGVIADPFGVTGDDEQRSIANSRM